jgi:hypothetical protein
MLLLEIRTLDLGEDAPAVGLDLTTDDQEPARGPEAAAIWARVLGALPAEESWALDFFSHLPRVREYCTRHSIAFREAEASALVIPAPPAEQLESLCVRFEAETFGARCGVQLDSGDLALERELAHRGLDAYHPVFGNYRYCAVCQFSDGSLVVLSETLSAPEILRRAKPALEGMDVEVFQPS